MQQAKHHHHKTSHSADYKGEVIITINKLRHSIHRVERKISDEEDRKRYHRKKKLACIALLTALAGTATAVVIYLTK